MLVPRRIRPLTLNPGDHPRGQLHVSAASGIVQIGTRLYMVADDELHLASLDAGDARRSAIELVRFAPGELPHGKDERKRVKPDVEVMLHFPGESAGGEGLLVLIGSGSRAQRQRTFVAALDADGRPGPVREIDAADLYRPMVALLGEVNIEGAFADHQGVHLFQRANVGRPRNVRVDYATSAFSQWLRGEAPAPEPSGLVDLELGARDGVPFGITDATPSPLGGCIFTAVAENTQDAYRDGACLASLVGWMDSRGIVRVTEELAVAPKVEGVAHAGNDHYWLVTDADDPHQASLLLEMVWAPASHAHR